MRALHERLDSTFYSVSQVNIHACCGVCFLFCGERAIDEDEVFAMELSVFEGKVEESIRLNPTNWDDDYGAPSHVCRFADQLERGNHR